MRNHVFFWAIAACLALTGTVEARSRHRGAGHCAIGQMYRPSLGTCQSRALFRRSMRKVATDARGARESLRHAARRDRRQRLREARATAERPEARPNRLLPTRPVPRADHALDEAAVRAAEAATMPDAPATGPASPPARNGPAPVEFAAIPWTASGPFSLDPRPRYAARSDLDWRR